MHCFSFSRLQGLSRTFVTLIATSAVFTAGCANMATTAIGSSSMNSEGSISGRLHGGNQPVAGATVKLWFAGEQGPTSAYVAATTTSSTDGGGSFHFVRGTGTPSGNTYVCPKDNSSTLGTNDNPMVYLVATGGDTINSTDNTNVNNNTASVFVAPVGDCNSLPNGGFIDMSETVTVATMAALQQYFNPVNETFYTDGTGLAQHNIQNAFSTIYNLVDVSTGIAVTSKTLSPAGVGLGHNNTSVTATPEVRKINSLANILASCINNASSTAANCGTLFSLAKPPSAINAGTTARGVGAAFPVATDVLQAIYYMLVNPTNSGGSLSGLYFLSTAASPFTPVLASQPSDWTIGIVYSSTSTCNGLPGHLIKNVQDLAVDTYGNIWIANNEAGGNLSALSPSGQPVSCVAIGSGLNTGVTIDSLGNTLSVSDIWVADSGSSNVYRYHPLTGAITSFPTASPALSIAADGTGNIYFSSPADSKLYEIPGAVAAPPLNTPVAIASTIGTNPARVMVDGTSAIWATSGLNYVTRATVSSPTTGTGASSIQLATSGPSYGIAMSSGAPGSNLVSISEQGTSNLLEEFGGATPYLNNWSVDGGAAPSGVAVDGAQNIWTIDNASNSIVEVGGAQQTLSPAGGFQKDSGYLGSGHTVAIDGSGNVWIALNGVNAISEIVGAAVPVFQPYATAIKTGSNLFQSLP